MGGIEPYTVRPIGVVRSRLSAPADAPNQAFEGAPEAVLEIDPIFTDALHRIRVGDALILLTWLHLADRDVLQTHPTGDTNIPLTGVFRTRSPDRPNPIGVHTVAVTALEGPTSVHVGAPEAIDGTPILDLKIAMREARSARRVSRGFEPLVLQPGPGGSIVRYMSTTGQASTTSPGLAGTSLAIATASSRPAHSTR
jgi:tRNA-Thr(GGU) m(6)t(6)A37 methyltransferase TsaA